MAKIYLVVKYTFIVAIVLGAGLALERLLKIKYWKDTDSPVPEELFYNGSDILAYENFDSVLKKHYLKCITSPSKPFCLLAANKRLELFQNDQANASDTEVIEGKLKNIKRTWRNQRLRIHSMLVDFSRIMKKYNIRVLMIEPSVLFCLLSFDKKNNMLAKGFNPTRLQGSKNIITVGVFNEDASNLEKANITSEMLSAGFKVVKFRKWIVDESVKTFETVHYVFIQQDVAVHVVVFYPRSTFLWHSGLHTRGIDLDGLLFVDDGIFEKFTLLPLNLDEASVSRMYVPHDFRYFMRETEASTVVKCSEEARGFVSFIESSGLTVDQLNIRAAIALTELKTILAPQMVIFWLWSNTLLGWFAKCDIFHYSSTLELAVLHKSIKDLEFPELFVENQFMTVVNNNETDNNFEYRLNCYGLDIRMFVLHEERTTLWYKQMDGEQNLLKFTYPVFTLCSTHLLGQKTHVPCDAVQILELENENVTLKGNAVSLNFTGKINFSHSTDIVSGN